MRDLLLTRITRVFLPGVIKCFSVNLLCVFGEMVSNRRGQVVIREVRHSEELSRSEAVSC